MRGRAALFVGSRTPTRGHWHRRLHFTKLPRGRTDRHRDNIRRPILLRHPERSSVQLSPMVLPSDQVGMDVTGIGGGQHKGIGADRRELADARAADAVMEKIQGEKRRAWRWGVPLRI